MKKAFLILIVLLQFSGFSQKLNAYKYAIVPKQFSFQQELPTNSFNNLVKAAMVKYGFETFFDTDELPKDAVNDNKVFVTINPSNGLIYSKITIILKDYRNNILFISQNGTSKEKDYETAYSEAFREAAKSLAELNHKYIFTDNAIFHSEKTTLNQNSTTDFSAIAVKNGFNLLNDNQVVYQLLSTSNKTVFLAKREMVSGIITKINDHWFFEYYKNETFISEPININFQ